MKKSLGMLVVLSSMLGAQSAFAFSVSPFVYSLKAYDLIISSQELPSYFGFGETIEKIESLDGTNYEVVGGSCTVKVEITAVHPKGFIGTGFPNTLKVVSATGCQK